MNTEFDLANFTVRQHTVTSLNLFAARVVKRHGAYLAVVDH
jgi:hypothetical protein